MELYQKNYNKLLKILPGLRDMSTSVKLEARGQTDVHVDVIEQHPNRLVLRMSHYLERLHGAAIPDPDMTIEVAITAPTRRPSHFPSHFPA